MISADDLVGDLRDSLSSVCYGLESSRGQVETASCDIGAAIVDCHIYRFAIGGVCHPKSGAEGERLVSGFHGPLVEGLTGGCGGVVAVERGETGFSTR